MASFLSFSSGRFRVLIYCSLGQLVQVFSSWPLIISQLLPPEHCQAKQGSPRHRPAACRPGHRQVDELSYVYQTRQTRMRQTAVPGHYANLDVPNGKSSASSKHLVSYTYTHISKQRSTRFVLCKCCFHLPQRSRAQAC